MPKVTVKVVQEYRIMEVHISKDIAERIAKLESEGKCLNCEQLHGGKKTRGQCSTCSQATYRAIKLGIKDENTLISEGVFGPKGKRGRKPKNEFTKKLLGR